VDIWGALEAAASTRPFGYTPFWLGPGVGRTLHRDRRIASVVEAESGARPRPEVPQANQVNNQMPGYIVS